MSLLAASIRPGDLLDHYRIEGLVGTGGMASLFQATDTKTGRAVAIKIPHPRREAARLVLKRLPQQTQKFDHPGLVKVLPNDGASHKYVVMEWVEGQRLRQILDEQTRLSLGRSVQIALKICDVLQYLHDRGVVHLDLKPDNIIVGAHDDIKLIDFDLARKARPGLFAMLRPKPIGTLDYASPEQVRGKACSVQSDIYSLGLILYEMLTGEVPFSGVSPRWAIELRLLRDPLPPREVNPDIPAELEELICRMISHHPAERPATARALGFELAQVSARLAGELVPSL